MKNPCGNKYAFHLIKNLRILWKCHSHNKGFNVEISIYSRRDLHLFDANTCILFVL